MVFTFITFCINTILSLLHVIIILILLLLQHHLHHPDIIFILSSGILLIFKNLNIINFSCCYSLPLWLLHVILIPLPYWCYLVIISCYTEYSFFIIPWHANFISTFTDGVLFLNSSTRGNNFSVRAWGFRNIHMSRCPQCVLWDEDPTSTRFKQRSHLLWMLYLYRPDAYYWVSLVLLLKGTSYLW